VEKGTYLESCLLHLFFSPVRKKAAKVIFKAYKEKIDLNFLISRLFFESEEEAELFCFSVGMGIEEEEGKKIVTAEKGIEGNCFLVFFSFLLFSSPFFFVLLFSFLLLSSLSCCSPFFSFRK